jgi:hypothetical protein
MAAFMDGTTRVSDELAERLRHHWDRGWNDADVELIMEPFADDVVFRSPFVSKLGTDPASPSVAGKDALRAYVVAALERTPGIRYTVDAIFLGAGSLVLTYTVHFPDGRPDVTGADLMLVDAQERIVDWRSHYEPDRA